MRPAKRLSQVLWLVLGSAGAFAADLPGSHDLPGVPRFPRAEIVDYREVAQQERIYPQGAIGRISNRLRYEGQVAAQGQLTAVTYQLPSEHFGDEAFNATRQALQAQGAELLYWCEGRECGSSSLWANAVFGNAKLYGPDDQQDYLLLRQAAPPADSLLALYGITRGNRRAYLHVEQLQVSSPLGELLPTAGTLLRQLRSVGELSLAKLTGEPPPAWSELLARSLNMDSTLRVSLAGAHAEAWREALVQQRVRAARLELEPSEVPGLRLTVLR
ncbi:DUF4892 domain-containing protein [Pseudomonas cavernae]|uniref:DUF4892 domain-containing protein n=1 Tax=Pseudomonas cavernae TaxID=2320867 RepID=A0A385Z4A9_9PSED|nr:DUF4892 domain-containing protein [Pseudomonas cavernae]AYC33370.1 DUF4892 domain-containing protein [Pseudomonas cavernae]